MPKKSKNIKEKDEVLKELAEKLKSSREKSNESKPKHREEEPEMEFDFRNINFQTFENDGKETSPVLEAIADEMPGPKFVRVGLAGTPGGTVGGREESNGATYLPTNAQNGEPKYVESSEEIYKTPEVVNVMGVGRGRVNEFNVPEQGTFFQPSREVVSEQQTFERVNVRPQHIDTQTLGRQNPVEAEKEKYQKYDMSKKSSY